MRILAAALVLSAAAFAQSERFAVASVQPCGPNAPQGSVNGSPGVVVVPCVTVKTLIDWTYSAYSNGPHFNGKLSLPIEGAPSWIDTARYTIQAKAVGKLDVLTMFSGQPMRALLEDKFKLKLHRASREVPVYALTAAHGSPRLERAEEGGCEDWEDPWDRPIPPALFLTRHPLCRTFQPNESGLDVNGATMQEFSALLPLDRAVIDQTGLKGAYNIHLDLSLADLGMAGDGALAPANPLDRLATVRTALRKIGLDLQPADGPQPILVIDHIERPSGN